MTDYKQLCAELLAAWQKGNDIVGAMNRARTALAQPDPEGELTDEELAKHLIDACVDAIEGESDGKTRMYWEGWNNQVMRAMRTAIAADRARRPAPEPPAEGEVAELVEWIRQEGVHSECGDELLRAAELLQRQHPQPVPVSERLPGPEDCIPHPRTKRGKWCWGFERCEVSLARPARWRLMHMETIEMEASHWLPAHALPLPGEDISGKD